MPPTRALCRARACSTSSSVATVSHDPQVARTLAEPIGERQQNPEDLLALALLELDDVVVDLDGGGRLEEQAGAAGRTAVDDAGHVAAVLGAHQQHEAAVPLGDDLVLQVLRRLLAARELLEGVPQPLAQAAQRSRMPRAPGWPRPAPRPTRRWRRARRQSHV
jgi:hypothetical protein